MIRMAKSSKFEVSKLVENDKHKFILHVLEVDWPTALAIVPVAIQAIGDGSKTDECVEVLSRALVSYQASLGQGDQVRLKAFLHPLLNGLAELLASNPPAITPIAELKAVISRGVGEENFNQVRKKLIEHLLPPGTPIGRTWRAMQRI